MNQVHLCIITGQPLANLIPLIQEQPDDIVLIHTEDKQKSAESFAQTLQKSGFTQDRIHIRGQLPTHPFEAIGLYMLELYESLSAQFPESRITWNATGGTKQMALAIWDTMDRKKDRVIYSDTRQGELEELSPVASRVELKSVLTPELYLHALGKTRRRAESDLDEWKERAQQRKQITRYLGTNAGDLEGLIQQFNKQLSRDGTDLPILELDQSRMGSQWKKALQTLEQANEIEAIDNGRYVIKKKDDVRYLTGGWLEEFVWWSARDQQLDHVEIGLKFGDLAYRKKGQDNEIDAFIVHRNRLLLIECKTGNMGKNERKDGDILYKLDSIGLHAGGTQATRVLVSAQPLQHETQAGRLVDTRARASANDIYTLDAAELKNLGTRIRQWKNQGQWS